MEYELALELLEVYRQENQEMRDLITKIHKWNAEQAFEWLRGNDFAGSGGIPTGVLSKLVEYSDLPKCDECAGFVPSGDECHWCGHINAAGEGEQNPHIRPGSQSLKVASKVFGDTQRTEKKCHHHVECDCESAGEDGKKYNDPDACQHVWVKVENLKVQGTMLCTLCGNIKAAGEGE